MSTTTSILYNYVFTTADTFYIRVRFCDNDNHWGAYYTFTIEIIDCKRYYYVKDHPSTSSGQVLGNIRQTVDENGIIISAQDYSPYGEILRSYNNADANDKYKFTEKERDKETNLDYFGARYYDAGIGRWLAVDPLADKYPGWSPYNYVMVNPLRLVDPKGMSAEDIYEMDDDGHITKKCDLPGPDVLYKKGNNKNFIVVNDDKLLPNLKEITNRTKPNEPYYSGSFYESSDKDETYKVFEWAARNSSVEWAVNGFNINGQENFVLSTSHRSGLVFPITTSGKTEYSEINKTLDMHSHKGEYSNVPSSSDNNYYLLGVRERYNNGISNYVPYYVYDVTNAQRFQYTTESKGFNQIKINNYKDLYNN